MTPLAEQRRQIQDFLRFHPHAVPVHYDVRDEAQQPGYKRLSITYPADEGDTIHAFLLIPDGDGPFPALLIHHQHNGERHLGKSEVCGLAGDPLQWFGPELAQRGFVVLAPDSICFEDRRRSGSGIEPHPSDTMEHFNEMCYRLIRGDTLMRKVLDDAALGLSLLQQHPQVIADRTGTFGHSYGGNTVLFHAALDERIGFACASGAACSYRYKTAHQVGLEMALTIPDFTARWDIHYLVQCIAPRPLLVVSAKDDPYSHDADDILELAKPAYAGMGAGDALHHHHYAGEHPLTRERFEAIVTWLSAFLS